MGVVGRVERAAAKDLVVVVRDVEAEAVVEAVGMEMVDLAMAVVGMVEAVASE